jgi:hypothetical protein
MPFPSLRRLQGLVGEPIGFAILFARHLLNRKRFQARDHLPRPLVQGLQSRTFHLVGALDLARQQLGIRLHVNPPETIPESVIEGREKSLIFSHIIGGFTEIF